MSPLLLKEHIIIFLFDLSKGYWQIALSDRSKPYTAFQTLLGLFQFTVLPFGLVTAQASCSCLMRKLLQNLSNVDNFVDDIIIFTLRWQQHIDTLRALLQRLKEANLTVKPVKCCWMLTAVMLYSYPSQSFPDESFDTPVTKHYFRESPMI